MTTNESKKAMGYLVTLLSRKPSLGDYLLAIRYSCKQFVRLCLRDLLNRDGLSLLVDIQDVA